MFFYCNFCGAKPAIMVPGSVALTRSRGNYDINPEKVQEDAAWDGMHAIVTNDWDTPAEILLSGIRSARRKVGLNMA